MSLQTKLLRMNLILRQLHIQMECNLHQINAGGPAICCRLKNIATQGLYFYGEANSALTDSSGNMPTYYTLIRRVGMYIDASGNVTMQLPSPYYSDINSLYYGTDGNNFSTSIANDATLPLNKAIYSALEMIAPHYSSSSTYNQGDCVIHQNMLYKCNTTISTAETWTSSHWTQTTVAELINTGA